ncbi:hypothetical protein Mhypo_01365 [Meiothermus hypogaeus]|uniref:Secreted protein n=1 Tax=Meiothermus hypogaeus TaxID=884155 RepID=A0ABX9MN57_9DEIN|nr:hypothetical protein Mhypo_01365 [Meiothermus hypogaeus]
MASRPVLSCLLPVVALASLLMRACKPVATTSGWVPVASIAAPSAAICWAVRPTSCPVPPMRRSTSRICGAVAAMLLERWLTASESCTTCGWVMPKMFLSLARVSPASWAEISKATATLAASSVKPASSSRAIPAWPAAAAIWVSSAAERGIWRDRAMSCFCSTSGPSAGVNSTTFFTSAKADSNSIAARVARPIGAATASAAAASEAPIWMRSMAELVWTAARSRPPSVRTMLLAGPEMRSARSTNTCRRMSWFN